MWGRGAACKSHAATVSRMSRGGDFISMCARPLCCNVHPVCVSMSSSSLAFFTAFFPSGGPWLSLPRVGAGRPRRARSSVRMTIQLGLGIPSKPK